MFGNQVLAKIRQKIKKKPGYTAAEFLLAGSIAVVLAGASFFGISAYNKDLDIAKQDNYAKQMFYAAENQMVEMKASGTWKTLKTKYPQGHPSTEDFWGPVISQKPSDYEYALMHSGLKTGSGLEENEWDKVKTDMRVIGVTVKDGHLDLNALSNSVLKYLLPFGCIDQITRTEGQYFIEYNADTAAVYAVWYSDHREADEGKDAITYEYDISSATTGLNNTGRPNDSIDDSTSKKNRRNHLNANGIRVAVGYFGTGFSTTLDIAQLDPIHIDLINGEDLILKIHNPNKALPVNLKIEVKGRTSGNIANMVIGKSASSRYFSTVDHSIESGSSNMRYNVAYQADSTEDIYTVVLDSITNEENDTVYGSNLYNLHFAGMFSGKTDGIIPGENIDVTVYCTAVGKMALPVTDTLSSNGLFWTTKETATNGIQVTAEAEITQMRHFENLSGEISNINTSPSAKYVINQVTFLNDITWDDTPTPAEQISSATEAGMYRIRDEYRKDYSCVNNTSSNADGTNVFGVWINEYNVTNYNGQKISGYKPNSFVAINNPVITRVNGNGKHVLNVKILRTEDSGNINLGLFGTLKGDITQLGFVSYPSAARKCVIEGRNIIGSIAGSVEGTSAHILAVDQCYANVKITGIETEETVHIGGLFGKAQYAKITRCYSGGFTEEGAYDINDPNITY